MYRIVQAGAVLPPTSGSVQLLLQVGYLVVRALHGRLHLQIDAAAGGAAGLDRPIAGLLQIVHGANHLMTLVNEARDRLRDAGVLHPERVLGPLLRASLENALALGDAALTGPVARGDAGTIARHLRTLGRVAPDSVAAYLALARRTADRAIASGRLLPVDAESLLGVLATIPATTEVDA